MRHALVLPLLFLAGAAAPTTRPTTAPAQQFTVQVQHVEYAVKPNEAAIVAGAEDAPLRAEAKELSSLQVSAGAGEPFETIAVIGGTTYRLAGKIRTTRADDARVLVEVDYCESSGEEARTISQIKSNVVATVDQPTHMGGMMRAAARTAMILTVKRPDPAP